MMSTPAFSTRMVARALLVWIGIAVLAAANGAFRELMLVPALGGRTAHVVSPIILCIVILTVAFGATSWITPEPRRDGWWIGVLWAALAVAFDVVVGVLETERTALQIATNFGLTEIIVFVVTLVAPALAAARATR